MIYLFYLMTQLTSVNSKRKIKRMEYKPINIEGCLDETLVTSSTSIPYEERHMFADKVTRQKQQQQKQMFMYEQIAEPSINHSLNSTCFVLVIELSGVQFGLKSYARFQNQTSAIARV